MRRVGVLGIAAAAALAITAASAITPALALLLKRAGVRPGAVSERGQLSG